MQTTYLDFSPIYEFTAPADVLSASDALLDLNNPNNELYPNTLNGYIRNPNVKLNYSLYDSVVFSWLDQCIHEVKQLHYVDSVELSITECWGSRTDRFQKVEPHAHKNSVLSGILFLSDHENVCTNFYEKNWWHHSDSMININAGAGKTKASVPAKRGKLILFPSKLYHDTDLNVTSTSRPALVFNTFLSGSTGSHNCYLNIKPTSVKDAHNNHNKDT